MSSHVMSEVQQTADRVGIIREGRLVAVEQVEELRERAVRGVEIQFEDPVEAATFEVLPGVSEVTVDGPILRCRLAGRADAARRINKKSTIFLTGQFFWHYMVNNPSCQAQAVAQLPPRAREKFGSCLVGGLDLPSRFRTSTLAFRDKIRDWETLFTLAAFTFYRGGSVVPVLGMAVDPTNQFSMEPFWTVDYFVTSEIAVNIGQRYFITPRGHSKTPIFESWGLAGLNQGRSETTLRVTYQF